MAGKEPLTIDLGSVSAETLANAYNSILEQGDADDAQDVMERFAAECPGIYDFLMASSASEKSHLEAKEGELNENERLSLENPNQLAPHAYSMLLGFLALREVASSAQLNALFGSIITE